MANMEKKQYFGKREKLTHEIACRFLYAGSFLMIGGEIFRGFGRKHG